MKDAIGLFTEWRRFKVKEGTWIGYDRDLRFLCLFLRNPEIEGIALEDVMAYLNGLVSHGWHMNSLLPKVMAVRKFLEFCRLRGHAVLNEELVPIPRKQFKLPRVASEDAYRKLIAVIPEDTNDPRHIRNAAIVRLLWDTGARNNEILSLNVEDLELDHGRAIIRTAKSRGVRPFRKIFWTGETNEYLTRWLEKREKLAANMPFVEAGAVFVSICGSVHDTQGRRFTIKGVGEMLRRYSNRAGIPTLNAHSNRHHKAHDILHQDGSLADVMNVLGHASVQSTTIYTMMVGDELEERARAFMPDDSARAAPKKMLADQH